MNMPGEPWDFRNRIGSVCLLLLLGSVLPLTGHRLLASTVLQTLHAENPGGAIHAFSELTQARDGNFYGTVPGNTPGVGGSIFRLTPAGLYSTVVTFTGPNGGDPEGALLLGADGSLYGSTAGGGNYNAGTLFRFTPGVGLQTIHSFNGIDGLGPEYKLLQASDGCLYGVTTGSATNQTVFRATTNGAVVTLTNFNNYSPGTPQKPNDGLVQGPDGYLYGTTEASGGAPGGTLIGSIYKVSTNGTRKSLVLFSGDASWSILFEGLRPLAGLVPGNDGFLYGTIGFNLLNDPTNKGFIFRMTTNGVMTTVSSFTGANGSDPLTRLLPGSDGAFYGITYGGGQYGKGTIFRAGTNGELSALVHLDGTNGGGATLPVNIPALAQGRDGNIYGTIRRPPSPIPLLLLFRVVEPPVVTSLVITEGTACLTWNSFIGGTYQVSCKDSFTTEWVNIGPTMAGTGSTTSWVDIGGVQSQRFYRITLLP